MRLKPISKNGFWFKIQSSLYELPSSLAKLRPDKTPDKQGGRDILIGLSTHSPGQAREAVRVGADYIGVGPIFKTNMKADVCDPVGLEYPEYVTRHFHLPFVAIGGIKAHKVAEIVARGATCVAMVTEIVGSDNMEKKILEIRKVINSRPPGSRQRSA